MSIHIYVYFLLLLSYRCKNACIQRTEVPVWPAGRTFQVGGAHGGHGRGRGLAETFEGSLLSGGVVRRAVLLFLLLLVGAHGLQRQLFPVASKHSALPKPEETQKAACVCFPK